MRLWHNGFEVPEETDEEHKERGSAGGEDFPCPNATSLYAPATGTLRARNGGTGGWTLSLMPDGYPGIADFEVMHCSDLNGLILNGPSIRVTEGQYVGRSGGRKGAPGAGNSTGPHTHEHIDLDDGTRTGIYRYMTEHHEQANSAATEGDEDMALEFMAEMPIQPPNYPNPGALTTDGSKHTFYVVPSKHLFWHVQNNGQLKFYNEGLGVRFIADQGADIMLGFDLLDVGQSV